jgi:hypothetical protein
MNGIHQVSPLDLAPNRMAPMSGFEKLKNQKYEDSFSLPIHHHVVIVSHQQPQQQQQYQYQ